MSNTLRDPDAATLAVRDVDQVRLFMLYCLFGGDAHRTAICSGVHGLDHHHIEALAHDFGWAKKLQGRGRLDTEDGKENARALNRVATYVTAEQFSQVLGNLIAELNAKPEFAREFCTDVDSTSGVRRFNTKNLVELAKGLEIVANVKYRALGDKVAEAADTTGKQSTANLTINIYKQLASRFDKSAALEPAAEISSAIPITQIQS
jgi:hypothetical protein